MIKIKENPSAQKSEQTVTSSVTRYLLFSLLPEALQLPSF